MNRTTPPSIATVAGIFAVLALTAWMQGDDAKADQRAQEVANDKRQAAAKKACGGDWVQWTSPTEHVCLRVIDADTVARGTL